MLTPLHPTFAKRIDDSVARIVHDQVEPWFFMQTRLTVKRFNGRPISYEGIEFAGTPRTVFWSQYIEPFLEDLVVRELSAAVTAAKEREVDARHLIPEVQSLLLSGSRRVLSKMAEVDQRLLGRGFPQQVPLRSIEAEQEGMRAFIDRHALAELEMWKPRPWYERWYEQNKFWVWAAGIVVAITGLAAKLI